MLVIHNQDSFTGSSLACSQIVRELTNVTCCYGRAANGGFLENLLKDEVKKEFSTLANPALNYVYLQLRFFFTIMSARDKLVLINTKLPVGAFLACLIRRDLRILVWHHEFRINNPIINFVSSKLLSLMRAENIFCSKVLKDNSGLSGRVLRPYVLDKFYEISKKHYIKNYDVLMISSLSVYKGIEQYLKLASISNIREWKYKFHLVLSCTRVELDKFLRDRNLTIPKNLDVSFQVRNVEEIMLDSKCLISLTQRRLIIETFGLTIAEGMASGLVVFAPGVGGPVEIIGKDGGAGFFINEYSPEDVLEKMSKVLQDTIKYNHVRARGLERSLLFSMSQFKKDLKELNFN